MKKWKLYFVIPVALVLIDMGSFLGINAYPSSDLSNISLVKVWMGTNNKPTYIMLVRENQVKQLYNAFYGLHIDPGRDKNGKKNTPMRKFTSTKMYTRSPYWWTKSGPRDDNNNDILLGRLDKVEHGSVATLYENTALEETRYDPQTQPAMW